MVRLCPRSPERPFGHGALRPITAEPSNSGPHLTPPPGPWSPDPDPCSQTAVRVTHVHLSAFVLLHKTPRDVLLHTLYEPEPHPASKHTALSVNNCLKDWRRRTLKTGKGASKRGIYMVESIYNQFCGTGQYSTIWIHIYLIIISI